MNDSILKNRELELLRYAMNNAQEEIAIFSIDGRMIYANDLTIINHNLSQIFSMNSINDFNIIEFKGEKWYEFIDQVRQTENRTKKSEVSKMSADKSIKYYEIKCNISTIDKNEEFWFFATDVTSKVTNQNKVKELNSVMDAILNNIPVYLFVKDSAIEFRYIYWNKAFENFSKIPSSKALGSTDYEIFPNRADAEKFRLDDLTVLHRDDAIEFDEEYIDAEGVTRYVHTRKSLIKTDKALPWLLGVSWDITDIKRTEKELIAARIKAEQSDRLKSAFLANMSHEIRTPLNAIVGFGRLIGECTDKEDRILYQDIIENNTNLLLQLINDILDISKIEAGTLEFIDAMVPLDDLLHEIYETQSIRVLEDVKLIYDKSPEGISLFCDRNRLLQVITNLINNAIKFTRKGEIHFGFKMQQGMVEFYVSDSGIGISSSNLAGIFNRFTKLNNFIQGTGLGLSICQTIIEKMRGKIWAESTENVGSTFYFAVPYSKIDAPDEEPEHGKDSSKRQKNRVHIKGKKTILIAEDNDSNFILLDSILSQTYDIVRAVNGLDAVGKFEAHNPDVILMDIKMPEMDGLEATSIIRKISDVPIVAVTSSAYSSDRSAAMERGCDDFITKPVSIDTLNKVLKKLF